MIKTPKNEIITRLKEIAKDEDASKITLNRIAKEVQIDRETAAKYCKLLNIPFMKTKKHKSRKQVSCEIDGVKYPSYRAAAKALGVHPNTIQYHLEENITKNNCKL